MKCRTLTSGMGVWLETTFLLLHEVVELTHIRLQLLPISLLLLSQLISTTHTLAKVTRQ